MGYYSSIEVSASGLTAQRLNMDVIANNIANANTTRTQGGGPFKRQLLVLSEQSGAEGVGPPGDDDDTGGGVVANSIVSDQSPDKLVYDPTHPDADANGFVHMPNIEVVKEMVDMIAASRAYQANVTAIQESRQMTSQTIGILQA